MKVKQYFHQSKLDENLGKCSVRKKISGQNPMGKLSLSKNPMGKNPVGKNQGVKTQMVVV